MGYLSKYGTLWGHYPQFAGRAFWVGPGSSTVTTMIVDGRTITMSDNNDGLSPERPLATINQAITNATANAGDVIMLMPGTHNASTQTGQTAAANIAVNKAGLTFIGLPYDPVRPAFEISPPAIITAPSATVAVSVTAADTVFLNCSFLEVSGQRTVDFTGAANRLTLKGCYFNMNVGAASTKGLSGTTATVAPTNMLVEDCIFDHDNTGTSDSYALDVGAGIGYIVRFNMFRHRAQGAGVVAWTTALRVNDNAWGTIDSNIFHSLRSGTAAITNGIQGVVMTGNGVIRMYRNLFGAVVTNPISGFGLNSAGVDILNNYVGTIGGGTGGSLVTVVT